MEAEVRGRRALVKNAEVEEGMQKWKGVGRCGKVEVEWQKRKWKWKGGGERA